MPTITKKRPAKPVECPWCRKKPTVGNRLSYDVDPYSEELFSDTTKVWMCASCRHTRADDV